MKVLTVVGARPQFIKAFPVSQELQTEHEEILVHTGQHYDEELSDVFFEELGIPEPEYNLGVGSDTHGRQTAAMLEGLEEVLEIEDPDVMLLYGDTNSTLAGAIVASKLDPIVAHIEAGLRSYNKKMPEEVNRVMTDHASDLLFAPSESAVETLAAEGITDGVYNVGDVMYDSLIQVRNTAQKESTILERLDLQTEKFILATIHRANNTNNSDRLESILEGLSNAPDPVVLPVHPRTEKRLHETDLWEHAAAELEVIDPVGYLDFIKLLDSAECVATDSGGVQKEAFYMDTFCVTMRDETEWIETIECGWNVLVGADSEQISKAIRTNPPSGKKPTPYGDGTAAESVLSTLSNEHNNKNGGV